MSTITARTYRAGKLPKARAVLDACGMAARANGEPFEWSEQHGVLSSYFSVRAYINRHELLELWFERVMPK